MEILKKMLAFFAIALIVVGAGCGIGLNFYNHQWVGGIGCIVLTAAAVPTVIRLAKFINK